MPLEESQKAKAVAWFAKHVQAICPVCQSSQGFSVGEIAAPTILESGFLRLEKTLPLVTLVCRNCFNVRLFSAVLMGILPAPTNVPQADQPVQPSP
jgi:hypothetical protein